MSVASKNLFDLLGDNDDEAPTPKSTGRSDAKIDVGKPTSRKGMSGNEAAFRDRGAGTTTNRTKPTDEAPRGTHRGGHHARVRGGRGSGHPRNRDDRHSKHFPSGSEKQAAQSWGQNEGQAELKDEQAGEEMAEAEKKDDGDVSGEAKDASAELAELEEKQVSYAEYLAQQAEKKLALSEVNIRKANEGSKLDKKWASAQRLIKSNEDYFEGTGGKSKRERERKQKTILEIDSRFVEPERSGRGRGGRGGRGRGRGEFRSGLRGGGRGRPDNAPINTQDQSAFPSLGS